MKKKKHAKNWILNLDFKKVATASGSFVVQDSTCRSFWYRLDFNNERIRELSEFVWFLRIRVECYHVAKLHTTMWQSPIKVAGADHAV